MTQTVTWTDIADEQFVELTTFRRSGAAVGTPVWVAADGDDLVVTTPSGSGKVKRLRHTRDVELRPSSRRGKVEPDAPTVRGLATVEDSPADVDAAHRVLRAKYGLSFRTVMLVERLLRRGHPERVIVRIRPAS